MDLLRGKVALITGASRGIGKAVALMFASEGADVAFTYFRSGNVVEEIVNQITAFGVKCKSYTSNASNFEDSHAVVTQVLNDFGKIDILVNNAGITQDGLMMRMTESQWDNVINVNLKSAFNFIHAVTPIMMRQKSGSIINMSSVVGLHGNAGQSNYSASKAGLVALSKSIAKELGSRGVRSNCIAPGFIVTEMTDSLNDDTKQQIVKSIPLRREGLPEDVAKTALFLASDMSSYVTGQVISCCGGMNI